MQGGMNMAHITIQYRLGGELHEVTAESHREAEIAMDVLRARGADNFIKHVHGDVPDNIVDLDEQRTIRLHPSRRREA